MNDRANGASLSVILEIMVVTMIWYELDCSCKVFIIGRNRDNKKERSTYILRIEATNSSSLQLHLQLRVLEELAAFLEDGKRVGNRSSLEICVIFSSTKNSLSHANAIC